MRKISFAVVLPGVCLLKLMIS